MMNLTFKSFLKVDKEINENVSPLRVLVEKIQIFYDVSLFCDIKLLVQ